MQARTIIAIITATLLVSTAQASTANLAPPTTTNNYIDQKFIHQLGCKTALPLMLPLPNELTSTENHFQYHPYDIQFAKKNAYWVNFNFDKDCQGAPICSAGSFLMIKINSPSLQQYPVPLALTANQIVAMQTPIKSINTTPPQKPTDNHTLAQTSTAKKIITLSLPPAQNYQSIMLNKNTPAYISAFDPNAYNATSFKILAWVNNNTYYQLTLKNQSTETMIHTANDIKVRLNSLSGTAQHA
jgi:hypothetical protein